MKAMDPGMKDFCLLSGTLLQRGLMLRSPDWKPVLVIKMNSDLEI